MKCLIDRIPSWFYRGRSSDTVLPPFIISYRALVSSDSGYKSHFQMRNCAMRGVFWSLAGVIDCGVTWDLFGFIGHSSNTGPSPERLCPCVCVTCVWPSCKKGEKESMFQGLNVLKCTPVLVLRLKGHGFAFPSPVHCQYWLCPHTPQHQLSRIQSGFSVAAVVWPASEESTWIF